MHDLFGWRPLDSAIGSGGGHGECGSTCDGNSAAGPSVCLGQDRGGIRATHSAECAGSSQAQQCRCSFRVVVISSDSELGEDEEKAADTTAARSEPKEPERRL